MLPLAENLGEKNWPKSSVIFRVLPLAAYRLTRRADRLSTWAPAISEISGKAVRRHSSPFLTGFIVASRQRSKLSHDRGESIHPHAKLHGAHGTRDRVHPAHTRWLSDRRGCFDAQSPIADENQGSASSVRLRLLIFSAHRTANIRALPATKEMIPRQFSPPPSERGARICAHAIFPIVARMATLVRHVLIHLSRWALAPRPFPVASPRSPPLPCPTPAHPRSNRWPSTSQSRPGHRARPAGFEKQFAGIAPDSSRECSWRARSGWAPL